MSENPTIPSPRTSLRALALSTAISLSLLAGPALAQAPAPTPVLAPEPPPTAAGPAAPPLAPPEALDQAVAPIALYPDELVAQVVAAAEYPAQVTQAAAWLQQHPGLTGAQLAAAVNQQNWEPSVKAVAVFPSVLDAMARNQAWTTALGTDYAQQPQAVLDAVQTMRQRAQQAGTLAACTAQERIVHQGTNIVIQPVNPAVAYVPAYDPWIVYGPPVPVYPGWVGVPGVYLDGPGVLFGAGIGLATFAAFGWGWHHWGTNWGYHSVFFNNRAYFAHGPGFIGGPGGFRPGIGYHPGFRGPGGPGFRGPAFHGPAFRGAGFAGRPGFVGHPGFGGRPGGFGGPGPVRAGGFGGFHGGFGGFHGGGFHGGGFHGGGFHGGGFHGGGRR